MRLFGVYLIVFTVGVLTLCKILHLMIFKSGVYSGDPKWCLDKTLPDWEKQPLASDTNCRCFITVASTQALRGRILNMDDIVLAENIEVFDLAWDAATYLKNHKNLSQDTLNLLIEKAGKEIAHILSKQFPDKTGQYYQERLQRAVKKKGTVYFAFSHSNQRRKQWITDRDTALLKKIDLFKRSQNKSGFIADAKPVRFKPYFLLANKTIGTIYEDTTKTGSLRKDGLEWAFDSLLAGQKGSSKEMKVNRVKIPLRDFAEPSVPGYDIYSTIDIELQKIVQDSLIARLISQNAEWGTAVIMETQTGHVKAIANLTRFVENGEVGYSENFNYAVEQLCEPGSTFKLASLLVYLQNTPNDSAKTYPIGVHTFNHKGKSYPKKDNTHSTPERGLPVMVFQKSSNTGIASMIFDVCGYNMERYLKALDSLGIMKPIELQLKGSKAPALPTESSFNDFFNLTHGVGFKITPLQTLAYYNAVANGGRLLEPLFVSKIEANKKIVQEFKPKVLNPQIASPEVIAKAQKYLEAVVYGTHGSARKFQKPDFTFAGKTGTRDYWDEKRIRANGKRGDYDYNYNNVSFCGYFPKDNPKYSCIIYISRVPVKSSLAAEVFAAIAQKITEKDKMQANPKTDTSNGNKYSSVEIASVKDLSVIFKTLGYPVSFDSHADNYVKAVATNNHPYISVIPFNYYTKPDETPRVIGMNARDAVYVLAQKGYKTIVKGKGSVYKQYFKGQTIVLELRTSFDTPFSSNPLTENP